MVSISGVLIDIIANLYISMYPVGDEAAGDLSLGFGGDASPSPMASIPPPPPTQMSATYLFTKIRTDKGMLINISALFCAVLIGVQALLGSQRRRFGSKAIVRLPLWTFYTISFPVVSYTIGQVQSVGSSHGMPDSQLLWAVGLLLLLSSVNGMSAFSRHDIEQSKGMLANQGLKTLLVLWLLYSRSVVSDGRWVLLAYFLLCWLYSILRMGQRMKAMRMASLAHGLVRSATVVADYMKDDTIKEHNPKNMSECKYLVDGEDKDSEPPSRPPYLTKVGSSSKAVTVDMVWKHEGNLLRSGSEWDSARAFKHTCLSFALFKLLKRRFICNLDIAEAGDQKTMEFVVNGLLANDGVGYERAFRVVELELSFLYDFFYTKYPVLFNTNRFCDRFFDRVLGCVRFFVLLGFFKVLLLDFMILDSPSEYEATENTFIYFNNVLLIVMILSIDMLQDLATGYSNWAVVQFVCDYVKTTDARKRCWKRGFGIRRALMKLVVAWRWQTRKWWSPHCWDNKLGQYSLLKSYDYNPSKTGKNALSRLSLRMMEPTGQGRRREKAVPLTAAVKKAVLDCLKETRGLPSVGRSLIKERGPHWACNLPTHTHMVLVWHIATTMCDLADTGKRDGDDHRLVATTLSGYCAYLLAFVPEMLPDNSYKAKQILDAVVEEAREHLGDTDTKDMAKRRDDMFELGAKIKPSSSSQVQDEQCWPGPEKVEDTQILILAAYLGWQLKPVDKRWELLARFWAELVLFLAPSNNADVHAEHLANGGEFITHLWALLTHAGIIERPLHASPV